MFAPILALRVKQLTPILLNIFVMQAVDMRLLMELCTVRTTVREAFAMFLKLGGFNVFHHAQVPCST